MKVLITGVAGFSFGVTPATQALACTETGRQAADNESHGVFA